jgi:hypothetical protein
MMANVSVYRLLLAQTTAYAQTSETLSNQQQADKESQQ